MFGRHPHLVSATDDTGVFPTTIHPSRLACRRSRYCAPPAIWVFGVPIRRLGEENARKLQEALSNLS